MDAKKIILNLDLHDDSDKQKAMKAVSKISGIDSITIDMKEMKLTVVGCIDPVTVVNKLRNNWDTSIFFDGPWLKNWNASIIFVRSWRKNWNASISFVGPAKEPEKKDEKKDDKKKDDEKKDDKKKEDMAHYNPYIMPYYNYPPHVNYVQHAATHYPPMATPYYSQEEKPNGCVIC